MLAGRFRFGKASLASSALVAGRAGGGKPDLDLAGTARLAQSVGRNALNLVVLASSLTVSVLPIVGFAGVLPDQLPVIMHSHDDQNMEHVGEA